MNKQRNKYKHNFMLQHYDRISLYVPKGERESIKAAAENINVSINGYFVMLYLQDMASGNSELARRREKGLSEDDIKLLNKWQISVKYRDMIENLSINTHSGTDKEYKITLKNGFINDITGSRIIYASNVREIRKLIIKSRKK